ncbi:hypothetical protein ACFYKX_25690 [Cytobacillus sp. FJAT-54145]|uniref:Uncharacterized protein n=1 Tax=Cytobacillus spartinae TaxID=3299023 RepID=A0ABW6KL65_9BACI
MNNIIFLNQNVQVQHLLSSMITPELSMGKIFNILCELVSSLEDAISFMETVEDENHERIQSKQSALENAELLLKHLTKQYQEAEENGTYDDSYRICSDCKNVMTEGYCIDGGFEHYCSDACLEKNMTKVHYNYLYNNGEGDSYYTSWTE